MARIISQPSFTIQLLCFICLLVWRMKAKTRDSDAHAHRENEVQLWKVSQHLQCTEHGALLHERWPFVCKNFFLWSYLRALTKKKGKKIRDSQATHALSSPREIYAADMESHQAGYFLCPTPSHVYRQRRKTQGCQ